MPQNITKIEDYKGFTQLPISDIETYFDQFAFDIEKNILRGDGGIENFGLLGDEVYVNMLADLDSNNEPQTQPYIDLIDGVGYYIATNGEKTLFGGIRLMLTFFVYSEYLKSQRINRFQSNATHMTYENAEVAAIKDVNYEAHKRWNKGVEMYNGEVYDYLVYSQSSFTNWNFTRQSRYIIHGIR
jgi:hypothetical protein